MWIFSPNPDWFIWMSGVLYGSEKSALRWTYLGVQLWHQFSPKPVNRDASLKLLTGLVAGRKKPTGKPTGKLAFQLVFKFICWNWIHLFWFCHQNVQMTCLHIFWPVINSCFSSKHQLGYSIVTYCCKVNKLHRFKVLFLLKVSFGLRNKKHRNVSKYEFPLNRETGRLPPRQHRFWGRIMNKVQMNALNSSSSPHILCISLMLLMPPPPNAICNSPLPLPLALISPFDPLWDIPALPAGALHISVICAWADKPG